MRAALLLLPIALVLPACGTERVEPADPLAVKDPKGPIRATEPRTGISVEVPRNWQRDFRVSPGMFRIVSGAAQVSGWAYKRTEPLPADDAALERAREDLVEEAKRRNPTLKLTATRLREVAGAPGIELVGAQTIEGAQIRTRSVHFFRDGTEFVIEALGPPEVFGKADRAVLEPLLNSLRFGKPAR